MRLYTRKGPFKGPFVFSDKVQRESEHDESQPDPLGGLGQLGVERLGLALGEEGVRAAGNGAGEAGARWIRADYSYYRDETGIHAIISSLKL